MTTKSEYTADSIKALEDIEHVRKRPGMYIGSQDADGIRHILKEVIDNSIDEWLGGHATSIEVEVNSKEHVFRVCDDGRGIPVETHKKTGKSTLTLVFTQLQAGAKFEKQTYAVSAGLHGVGLKATNALSDKLTARVWRSGVCYEQDFSRGTPVTPAPLVNKSKNERGRTGTEVEFRPDPKIFGSHRIDVPRLSAWLEETSHLCPGLSITVIIDGERKLYQSQGLSSLISSRAEGTKTLHPPMSFESDDRKVSVSLLWTEADTETPWFSACNASSTPEGGRHVDGAIKAITDVLTPFAKKAALVESKDLIDGLYAGIQVLVAEPQFKSQTKDKLLNSDVRDEVYSFLYPRLKSHFDQNKKLAEQIVARAAALKKARESYKKLRGALGQLSNKKDAKGVLPDKLVEAIHCRPEDRELFIVEGDSAGGSAKVARDPKYQEVLPLKGKIPNAVRTPPDKLLQHSEIVSMLKAIGIQLGPKGKSVDLSNVRVGKVLLLMDADPDGSHIASLALTFFCTWAPDFVRSGALYVVDSPLFVGVYRDQRWYAHDLAALEKAAGRSASALQVSRLKGHGEASAEELRHYAMNPGTRRLWKISMGEKDQEVILSLMDTDSTARKTLLGLN